MGATTTTLPATTTLPETTTITRRSAVLRENSPTLTETALNRRMCAHGAAVTVTFTVLRRSLARSLPQPLPFPRALRRLAGIVSS